MQSLTLGGLPKGMVAHEAVKEWRRWRNDLPRRYASLSEMPLMVSVGFEYLCGKYGKHDIEPHQAGHDAMVAEMQARIDRTTQIG